MRKQLFLLFLIPSLSLQALLDLDPEIGSGNAGSVSANEMPSRKKKWSRKKTVTAAALGILAIGSAQTPLLVGTAVTGMVESGSPITAYPASFNCSGIQTGRDQQEPCPPVFPNITRNPNCTYEKYKSHTFPPDYVKGVCGCGRPNGCACIIEECKGAEKFKSAYNQYLASLITGGVLEGLGIAFIFIRLIL